MSEVQNSLSSFVRNLMIEHKNSVEVWKKFSDALNSKKNSVTIDIESNDGSIEKIKIPTFGWLKAQVERLDNNVRSLSGVNDSAAVSRLPDGSFRQIILNTVDRDAPRINSLNTPNSFDYKNNWFFENFLNPLLFVNFELTGQVDSRTEKVLVRKYILNLANQDQLAYYQTNLDGRNDLDLDLLEEDLETQSIDYFTDEETRDIPYQENLFYGDFDVIKIFDDTVDEIADITSETKRKRKYKLNKLTYSTKNSTLDETETLKVGDNLVVNTGNRNSRYEIVNIESSTNIIELNIIEGYDSIQQGANTLSFYNKRNSFINLELPIGFNERMVVFIRPIDHNSNIPATFWSPGVAFYTNSLTIDVSNSSNQTLTEFYNTEVVDFGKFMLGMAKDSTPPAILGELPDPPQLSATNFRVTEINQHLTQRKVFDEIRKLQNEKNKINSDIEEIDVAVTEKREELATTKFNSNIQRSKVITELQNFERDKQSKLKLLSSIISKINNLAAESSIGTTSKYRIRGFWPFPEPKLGADGSEQEVIQFMVEYRYLSKEGDSNPIQQLEFSDNNGESRSGAQSTWERFVTNVRPRAINEETGRYEWQEEDVQDADAVNINQLDIPISKNEKVQIRMRSISEAGFPNNAVKSEYSSTIEVEFPEDLSGTNSVTEIIDEASKEKIKVDLDNDLASMGLNIHLSDSFTANEKYFSHTSNTIDSGFLSPEQKPVALSDKLIDFETEIERLKAELSRASADLTVVLQDENGNTINLSNNQVNSVFAGYYRDIVSNLSVKKGVIVNRTFLLSLRNNSQTDLNFISKEPGTHQPLFSSPFGTNANQNYEKYDEVPLINLDNSAVLQSPQLNGQFIYFRKGGIDLQELYKQSNSTDITEYHYEATFVPKTSNTNGFVAINDNGSIGRGNIDLNDTSSGGELDNPIYVHIEHPSISINSSIPVTEDRRYLYGNSKLANINTSTDFGIFDDDIESSESNKQWSFNSTITNGVKYSFRPEDQYLIGPGSCGSYLYPLIRDISTIRVDGDTINSIKTIKPGEEINIPLVFQFRMTDYFGDGETGLGNVGGDYTQSIENLTYEKTLGFDIYTDDNRKFSYDIKFNAIYKADGATLKNINAQTFDASSTSTDIIL